MARSKLPEYRPVTGDLHVQIEVDYETVLNWQDDGVQVTLRVNPTADYADITDDHDYPTDGDTPIAVDDLPPKYQRQVTDTIRRLTETYEVTQGDTDLSCTASDDGILSFTTHLHE